MADHARQKAEEIAKLAPQLNPKVSGDVDGTWLVNFRKEEAGLDVFIDDDLTLAVARYKGPETDFETIGYMDEVSDEYVLSKLNHLANTPRVRWT